MSARIARRGALAGAGGFTVLVAALLVVPSPLRTKAILLVDNMVDILGSVVDNTVRFIPRIAVGCPLGAGSSLLPLLPGDCAFELVLPLNGAAGRASRLSAQRV